MRKLNLGCGPVQPEGWENVDGSLRAWLASRLPPLDGAMVYLGVWPPTEFNRRTTFADLSKRLPWPDGSVDYIYLGEVLEHFTREDGLRLLQECSRILKAGGTIRCRVPDNLRFWRSYVEEFDDAFGRPRDTWGDRHTRWVEMFFNDICVRRRLFASHGHYHKWMYDEISLIHALEQVGFASVERRRFGESAIPEIEAVETRDDLIVEGTKEST